MKKTFIRVPDHVPLTGLRKILLALMCCVLSPIYWIGAYRYRVPGLQVRKECARLGLRLLLNRKAPVSNNTIYFLMFRPMDSVRYFEFDFMWRLLADIPIQHYLDVSSPRLFPVLLSLKHGDLSTELVNPDIKDLAATEDLIKASDLSGRCHVHGCMIEKAPFAPASFDCITSISVLEHIPDESLAIQKIWSLLKQGGRLLLSVPCAADSSQEFIDHDEFGLSEPDKDGFVFWQRFYDQRLLQERIFSVTGQPRHCAVYGEKVAGTIAGNTSRKRTDPGYPIWREPYMMGKEYGTFNSIADLPGQGVIAMEFVKM